MRPLLLLASLVVAALSSAPVRAAESEEDLVVKVRKAIQDGQKFLRAAQDKETGNWEIDETCKTYPGAWTSLALLALLETGVSVNDPAIQKGLAYLRTVEAKDNRTYAVSLQTMALARAGLAKDLELIQRNVKWLLSQRMPQGWTYRLKLDPPLGVDNSNTQYAVLALHMAQQAGVQVDPKALEEIQKFYRDTQRSGGWGYKPPPEKGAENLRPAAAVQPRMTMTAAGLCGLLITGMHVTTSEQKLDETTGKADNCGVYRDNDAVAGAIRWIGVAFPHKITLAEAKNLGFLPPFYCLYGIERAGRLSGQRYFGGHDWYRIGCEFLTRDGFQKADGSWKNEEKYVLGSEPWPVVTTSFALLFLGKGQAPVLVTKLAYGNDNGWNNKRNDMRNLTAFASHELFADHPLAWQVFDVRKKAVEEEEVTRRLAADLLEVPILYFNGHNQAPRNKEEKILKAYLQNGGFLFAEACCGDAAFEKDFRELMKRIFGDDAELKRLPKDHPVWNASGKFTSAPEDFELWGIEHRCKWVVIFSKTPVAGFWEENLHQKGRGRKAFELGANIIAYATGMVLPEPRGRTLVVADPEQETLRATGLRPAQVRLDGDPTPTPTYLNMLEQMRKLGLKVGKAMALDPNSDPVSEHDFFFLHERKALDPDREKWAALYDRLKKGGTLLADAGGSSKEVDVAFRKLMAAMWQDEKLKLEPIPADDPLFGKELKTVRRRDKPGSPDKAPYKVEKPQLEGIKYNERWVVIYSPHDLGCALEYTQAFDHVGHDRASALRLFRAILQYAEGTKPK